MIDPKTDTGQTTVEIPDYYDLREILLCMAEQLDLLKGEKE